MRSSSTMIVIRMASTPSLKASRRPRVTECMDSTTATSAGNLDRFLPEPDIRERHRVVVRAPAEVAYREAMAIDFESLLLVRAIVRAREILMGSKPAGKLEPMSFLARMHSMGWRVL